MDFWDRLCKYLGVRKISVMDVSKKYGLDYRLLHAITKGHPWYGDWGYEFGSGSFALTHDAYKEAVETLSNLPLSLFICQGRKPRTHIQELILYYQSLSESELVNTRDLFQFLMSLVHDAQKSLLVGPNTFKKRRSCAPGVLCAWTSGDIKRVEDAMIKVLRAVSSPNWVSWRTLRGAVCKVGPPELLDYCLKELGAKQAADGMTVHARCNPDSGALEYRLESGTSSQQGNLASGSPPFSIYPSRDHVLRDLKFLYEALLHPRTMLSFGPEPKRDIVLRAASRLLDCKQFVKDYKPETFLLSHEQENNHSAMFFLCQAKLLDQPEGHHSIRAPPELVVLPPKATIADLKLEASRAFQEVYIMFKGFQAEELVDYRGVEDSALVKLLVNHLRVVGIRGRCPVKSGLTRFRMERGTERWTVDCSCGARDDDGERMLACDVCSIWQHTRCAGIPDFDAVPGKFVCSRCRNTGRMALAKIGGLNCKDESVVVASGGARVGGCGGGKSLAMLYDVRDRKSVV